MTKFEKLTADLKAAYNAAYPAAIKTDEGGTMNFDAPGVWLPRWPESKTLEAVKAAGWVCMPCTSAGAAALRPPLPPFTPVHTSFTLLSHSFTFAPPL